MPKSIIELMLECKGEISECIKMKYFQSKLDPLMILYNPNLDEPDKRNNCEASIFALNPLDNQIYFVSLYKAALYLEISEEQFKQVQEKYNKGIINKLNLSEQINSRLKGFTEEYSDFGMPGQDEEDEGPIY